VRWFYQLAAGTANIVQDPAVYELSDQANREINETLLPCMEKLSHHPDDSMISHMLWAGREGTTPREISQVLPTLKIILVGGMQEPGHAAASTLYGLFGRPDQWELLVNDPVEWIPLAIGEGLRWIAPIGSVNRQAAHDATVRGVTMPEGALIQAVLASANRDEAHFDDPDVFDIERSKREHLAFGGEHFCSGHFFGRHVERVMFEELVAAAPSVTLDPDIPVAVTGWLFRAARNLPVKFAPPPVT
jgi:cytochrome P450